MYYAERLVRTCIEKITGRSITSGVDDDAEDIIDDYVCETGACIIILEGKTFDKDIEMSYGYRSIRIKLLDPALKSYHLKPLASALDVMENRRGN